MSEQSSPTFPSVDGFYTDTIHVTAQNRDWSEGYGETWEYYEAPECPECSSYAQWIAGDELYESTDPSDDADAPEWAAETWEAWRCPDPECERFGQEIDSHETAEGPMMNYSYALPSGRSFGHEHAAKIADLPLCIIDFQGDGYALALTGGGMDLSWEICEAFMRLGHLPPLAYCDLPRFAGKEMDERARWIVAGCLRSCEVAKFQAERAAERLQELIA